MQKTEIVVRERGSFWKGLAVGAVIGIVVTLLVGKALVDRYMDISLPTNTESEVAQIIEEHFAGYTALDFEEAIMGAAKESQELIVMEQPMQLTTTITKSGLGDLSIFMKTKNITYYGTGIYTVDLAGVKGDSISVDNDKKTVTITIPHADLKTVDPDYDKIEFEDTELGMFAIFDLTLTAEQQNEIEKSVMEDMAKMLTEDQYMKQADQLATKQAWDTFQPLISAVAPDYRLEIQFDKNPGNN